MAFAADYPILFDRLDEELRDAPNPSSEIFAKIIGGACTRIRVLSHTEKAERIDGLIDAGAWTDAALALLELELPAWQMRRLARESGEWFCSLSRQPDLPAGLDETADASHPLMPLSILQAFLQARRRITRVWSAASDLLANEKPTAAFVCCDNFG